MSVIHIHTIKCDGCEKESPLEQANEWYSVQEIITNMESLLHIKEKQETTGFTGVTAGDFCSLVCLSKWAFNADKLKGMERGLL